MLAGDGITSSEFGEIADKAAVGTLMTFAPDPRLNPAAKGATEAFRSKGFEPEAYTLYSYAAVQIIKAGVELSGSFDAETVATALKSEKKGIATVIGDIAFDNKGDRRDQDYTIYEWRNNSEGKLSYSVIGK
jgi:branched-chain amino acid transport system substrate-binding protein